MKYLFTLTQFFLTGDGDEEVETSSKKETLMVNTNASDAIAAQKAKRDKIAEVIEI